MEAYDCIPAIECVRVCCPYNKQETYRGKQYNGNFSSSRHCTNLVKSKSTAVICKLLKNNSKNMLRISKEVGNYLSDYNDQAAKMAFYKPYIVH